MMRLRLTALAALIVMGLGAGGGALAEEATNAWWSGGNEWPLRKPVTADMTGSGAPIVGQVGRAPLLVRLHGGNFKFDEAAESGADLRFIDSDGKTPLAYHIETWDPATNIANIWVDGTSLSGGAKKTIYMYFGNKEAPLAINTPATFDADYVLVYHFDEPQGQPVLDKTNYKNASVGVPAGSVTGGAVGRAAQFAGTGIQVQPSPALTLAAGAPFSISAWVRPDAAAAAAPDAAIFSRREAGGTLLLGLAQGVPYVQVGTERVSAPAALAAGRFAHLAAASDGAKVILYVDGRAVGEAAAATPALAGAIGIGGDAAAPFTGLLDELRVSKSARPAGLFAFDAAAQGPQSKLMTFSPDEEQGAGGGVIGYIIDHMPFLDWVIVGVCMTMLAIAIAVMVWKSGYISRCSKANAVFLKRYRRMEGDLESLEKLDLSTEEKAQFPRAPLARIYQAGIEELEERRRIYGNVPLSGEAVESMRAELDAQQVTENQKLDLLMVLLTIAISGGPFVGLLGTVMGVMNVFGGVALAGDVNVNAIAPGIAAALMATVAGLAAAIPALFGYNYLNSRISSLSDEMRVFVDRLVTRLAETQAHKAMPPPVRLAAE